jgi:hypothetical protein
MTMASFSLKIPIAPCGNLPAQNDAGVTFTLLVQRTNTHNPNKEIGRAA